MLPVLCVGAASTLSLLKVLCADVLDPVGGDGTGFGLDPSPWECLLSTLSNFTIFSAACLWAIFIVAPLPIVATSPITHSAVMRPEWGELYDSFPYFGQNPGAFPNSELADSWIFGQISWGLLVNFLEFFPSLLLITLYSQSFFDHLPVQNRLK